LRSKAEDIRVLENRRNAAKRKLEISDQQASLRDRRKNIREQMAWAQVEDQEKVGGNRVHLLNMTNCYH
jgi:ATP-dependent RNA helicase DDX6/DHH1